MKRIRKKTPIGHHVVTTVEADDAEGHYTDRFTILNVKAAGEPAQQSTITLAEFLGLVRPCLRKILGKKAHLPYHSQLVPPAAPSVAERGVPDRR